MKVKRTLLVEDHPAAAQWLTACIMEAFPDTDLVVAVDVFSARREIAAGVFDLALVDIGLPDGSGMDVINAIRARPGKSGETHIVVSTIYDDDATLFKALQNGAQGYILKDRDRDKIVSYLSGITRNEAALSGPMAQKLVAHFNAKGTTVDSPPLAPREEQVLASIALGQSVSETAKAMGVAPNTAKSYVKSIYAKLGISTRAEATAHAIRRRLIDID